jgi:hypothetical protein
MSDLIYQALTAPVLPQAGSPDNGFAALLDASPVLPARRILLNRSVIVGPVMVFPSLLPLRDSQNPIEVARQYSSAVLVARDSQLPVEAAWAYSSGVLVARVSQLVVEVAYPYTGCYLPPPRPGPQPPACVVDLEPGPDTAPCAAPAPIFP